MAKANHKPRRAHDEHIARISLPLEAESTLEHHRHTAFPWMQVTDAMLEHAGFLPGNQVLFTIDYRPRRIIITPDYAYVSGGRYMTEQETQAMPQRCDKRK